MTVAEWLTIARASVPNLEAQMLAAHVLGVDRSWLFAHPDADFPELAGGHLLARRLACEPLAYILGWREFYSRRFLVDRRVLIPRHETEILVEAALRLAPQNGKVLDVGAGSGCIGITIKLERPDLAVAASDISADAIAVANLNAKELRATVEFIHVDLLPPGRTWDVIVTNPPYIGLDEPLPSEVRDFEPTLALFANEGGYGILARLAKESIRHLRPGSILLTEIGHGQSDRVQAIFGHAGWTLQSVIQDLNGTERVLAFTAAAGKP